jgi:hypothetical protein
MKSQPFFSPSINDRNNSKLETTLASTRHISMKLISPTLLALMATVPFFAVAAELADSLNNTLTIIIVTEWTDGVINEIPIRPLAPDDRIVDGLSLQRVSDLYFDHVGQTYEFNTAQTGWGGHEYYQVS